MKQIGTRELETKRLHLRRIRAEDAETMFDNWASDAQVTKYLTWSPHENREAKGIYAKRLLSLGFGRKNNR